ncbi:MAG TPA: universal stress protein [Fimbriimonadaceae bacterium]|nr:universal stress protein [Fimbriimonadaceae bacterium]
MPTKPDDASLTSGSGSGRGALKIFLGFAAGVGKTYAMLDEAHRRRSRGQDVVIGFVEAHGRATTAELASDLEAVPRKTVEFRGATAEELDTEAVLARKPYVVLVDALEHTNASGSAREKRWQDVDVILEAGINVLSTLDVEHLESLNNKVSDILGTEIKDTVPDRVLHEAAEIEMIDIPVRALINRLERGDVVPMEQVAEARAGFFREGNLSAMRELALREAAGRVDEELTEYRREKRIEKPWAVHDKVMICLSPNDGSLRLLRRGWRLAQRLHSQAVAVFVEERAPDEKEERILREDVSLAERLEIPVVKLTGKVVDQLIEYARANAITQIVIGHSNRTSIQQRFKSSIITDLVRELKTIDILVVAAEKQPNT